MRSIYLHARELFETSSADDKALMGATASTFFGDLNRVLNEYVILQVSSCSKSIRRDYPGVFAQTGFAVTQGNSTATAAALAANSAASCVKRVKAGGGQVLRDPIEVLEGNWIVQCADPQGAIFALVGHRGFGYFESLGWRQEAPRVKSR